MRIFKDQIKTYNKIINKYNTIFNGDKLDFNSVVNMAVAELLQSDFDFKNLKNYNYYTKGGSSWEYKYVKLDYKLWKQIAEKLDFKNLTKNIQEDKLDNIVNTALFKATKTKWDLRKQIIDNWKQDDDEDVVAWKKLIIDNNGWDIEKLMRVLKAVRAVDNTDDYKARNIKGLEVFKTKCPLCDRKKDHNTEHTGWLIENGKLPYYSCVVCREEGTIIDLLDEPVYIKLLNGMDPVSFIYSVLYSDVEVDLTKNTNIKNDEEIKKQKKRDEELKKSKEKRLDG